MTGPAGTPAGRPAGTQAGSTGAAPVRRPAAAPAPAEPEVDGSAEDTDTHTDTDTDAPPAARRRRRGRRTWLLALSGVVVLALLLAVVTLVRTPSEREVRESALLAARTYTTSLTTFDARTLEEDAERVRRSSTAEFVKEYEQTLEGLRETVEEQGTVSTGTVVGAGLEELEGDSAAVLVAVNQQIVSGGGAPRTEANRLRMVLERRDGQWLIQSVERL